MYTTYADVRCCLTSTYPNNSVIDLLTLTFLTECPLKIFNFCASFLVFLFFALSNFHTICDSSPYYQFLLWTDKFHIKKSQRNEIKHCLCWVNTQIVLKTAIWGFTQARKCCKYHKICLFSQEAKNVFFSIRVYLQHFLDMKMVFINLKIFPFSAHFHTESSYFKFSL